MKDFILNSIKLEDEPLILGFRADRNHSKLQYHQ